MKRAVSIAMMLLLSGPLAWAQGRAARSAAPPLDKADQQAMLEAIQRLNDHNPIMVGTTETWKGEASSGSVHLDRIFHLGGRDCHAMTYRVISHPAGTTKRRRSTRQATWCRTGDGPWKEG